MPWKWRELVLEVTPPAFKSNKEHGVGLVKKQYLVQELGLETVETMRRIKVHPRHFD
jgi:FAD/FMN-containing dehydrogenase